MEATNLGAYFGGKSAKDLQRALLILEQAPHYTDSGYMDQAKHVLDVFPEGQESLAVPTWFYGHEPSNLFASHIAKYFSNSIREDTLLAICLYGIIYAPGSAGTTQEIFMDAAQNHYGTFGYSSPMVFLGRDRYEMETMLFPALKQLAKGKDYQKLLFLTDDPEMAVNFIEKHPPLKVK
jgi:predicted Rossmann-fold nucleotide-binding protein